MRDSEYSFETGCNQTCIESQICHISAIDADASISCGDYTLFTHKDKWNLPIFYSIKWYSFSIILLLIEKKLKWEPISRMYFYLGSDSNWICH